MFDRKSELNAAVKNFFDSNSKILGMDEFAAYFALVESRISNDILLINNQQLCIDLGVDVKMLYTELQELVVLRQKLYLSPEAEKKNGYGRRSS